ncbi:hypothetical protein [Methylobacter sp.]|uniref:hypothetical protein n=1 Tax=Methylobacter sp. TaxID=2051955 RepID=UPI0011F406E7|nr:hypothetical protein [Methylobacter sp.]TAK59784.1 MAG: hypothetical protein EPO18_19665 [Methylobacter sp.]
MMPGIQVSFPSSGARRYIQVCSRPLFWYERWNGSDVGRNKPARRQQGRAFPAIGTPETPVLRLTHGQAYSGLRRDVYNNERSGVRMKLETLQNGND